MKKRASKQSKRRAALRAKRRAQTIKWATEYHNCLSPLWVGYAAAKNGLTWLETITAVGQVKQ